MDVLFFCKFPPPFTGQTIGTKLLFSILNEKLPVERINTSFGKIRPNKLNFESLSYVVLFSWHILTKMLRLYNKTKGRQIDVLYIVASPSLLGVIKNLVTVIVVRERVSKIVAHVRNGNYHEVFGGSVSSYIANSFASRVDQFIFLSESLADRSSHYVCSSKRRVVRNSIDISVRCTSGEVSDKITRRKERAEFRVLYLSNMIASKGYMDVAQALRSLREETPRSTLRADFVGAWPDKHARDEFTQFTRNTGLQRIIHVHGRVANREKIKRAYLDADVFVLPTYYPNEAQPRSIIEAFNAGTPVIATEHASIPEYVFDDENGYLVEKQAPTQIKQGLEALTNCSNWEEKAWSARRTYEEMFSPNAVQDALMRVIRGKD